MNCISEQAFYLNEFEMKSITITLMEETSAIDKYFLAQHIIFTYETCSLYSLRRLKYDEHMMILLQDSIFTNLTLNS